MSVIPPDGSHAWRAEPLYQALHAWLPDWRTNTGILDVPAIAAELRITDESIYKWFRRGELPPRRARELFNLATRQTTGDAPALTDFYQFCP